jgi:hypothetical protein
MGEKTMIGTNGWLERTGGSPEKLGKKGQKKMGIFQSLKKMAKEMVSTRRISYRLLLSCPN